MKIKDLKIGMSDINLKAKVVDVSEPREVRTRFGYATRVATATLEDDSGKIPLTLWGDQTDQIGEGDTVEIVGGYIKEFRGELQLNVPRKGEVKVVS